MYSINRRYGLKLSLSFLVSIILVFGWAIAPAQAHCAGNHTGNHPHCAGDSPSGTPNAEIIYIDDSSIKVAHPDGSSQTTALQLSNPKEVSWTTDGSGFLFVDESSSGIFFQAFDNATGLSVGPPQLLISTGDNPHQFTSPTMSPGPLVDGNYKIAFADSGNLFLMNTDGSDLTQLTVGDLEDIWPKWSPQSDKLVFGSVDVFGKDSIQVIDVVYDSESDKFVAGPRTILSDSTFGVVSLTGFPNDPIWSPDGNYIMISSSWPLDLFLIPVDKPDEFCKVTNTPDISESHAAFSPDGSKIIYRAEAPWDPSGGKSKKGKAVSGIAVLNIDGCSISSSSVNFIIQGNTSQPDWR